MQLFVRHNDVDFALKQLKRKLRREGVFSGAEAPAGLREAIGASDQAEGRVGTAAAQSAAPAA
jgi:hypothetical protein